MKEHNSGKSIATAYRRPLVLIHYEAFVSQEDAFAREKWLKSGYGRTHMQKMLTNTLKSLGG